MSHRKDKDKNNNQENEIRVLQEMFILTLIFFKSKMTCL